MKGRLFILRLLPSLQALANPAYRPRGEVLIFRTIRDEIAGSAFATVRQRIAHHLLYMARSQSAPPYLMAHITQTDLADAAASVREVAVRELRALRNEGLIRPGRAGIAIMDPDGLQRIAAEAFKPAYGT